MTLDELAEKIHNNAVAKGFWDPPRRFPEILTLAHSELSEAFEAWRNSANPYWTEPPEGKPEGWAAELVDCIIVCLDLLSDCGEDIESMIEDKMIYNENRPTRHNRRI